MRQELTASGWKIVNFSKLPVVCFVDGTRAEGSSGAFIRAIAQEIVASGEAWITSKRIGERLVVLRASVNNYRTEAQHVQALVGALNGAREAYFAHEQAE